MYLPKSKYQQKESGGQFMYEDTKEIYIGSYVELSDGTLYTGTRFGQSLPYGRKIIPLVSQLDKKQQVLYRGRYNNLEEDIYEFHQEVKKIIFRKPLPTSKDYEKNKFRRYFAVRKNSDANYIEIDKKTYKSLKSKSNEYDWHLYQVGNLEWFLGENSVSANSMSIRSKLKKFPYLRFLFSNLQEYTKPSNFRPSIVNKTQPQKKELARSKYKSEINKTNKNKETRAKERLRKKREQQSLVAPSLTSSTPNSIKYNPTKSNAPTTIGVKTQQESIKPTPNTPTTPTPNTPSTGGGMSSGGGGGGY